MTSNQVQLENLAEEELKQILYGLDALARKDSHVSEIQTDDELHTWIETNLGLNIPRIAVCEGHNAPFEIISDLFFNRVDAAILVANRGGGKTMTAALMNFLYMRFIPTVECISVGAQDIQSRRAYQHFKVFQRKGAQDWVDTSLISETVWKNGSKYEILTGSLGSVNGPHVQKVHRDEVELMDKKVFQESLQIEQSKIGEDGRSIPSQTLVTSTRKTPDGLMQELLDECREAELAGRKPPYKVYIYCIKECVSNQSGYCRIENPDLSEEDKCDCHRIQKGEWDEDKPRTLDQVCNGLFAKSDGFAPLEDIQKTFVKSSKAIWEAQQECKRPYAEEITLHEFSREKHGIKGFEPDPENGLIFMGLDVGGTSPHAVEWGQILDYEIEVLNFRNEPKRLPEGSIVVFDELYIAEIGNEKLADLIVMTESEYKRRWPKFRVRGRFVDPQAKITRLDFRNHEPPLVCSWPAVTRDREEHLKRLRDRVIDGFFYVSLDNCPMFCDEIEAWNINIARKKFDHAVDATLYLVSNIHSILEKGIREEKPIMPGAKRTQVGTPNPFEPASSRDSPLKEELNWRRNIANL